MTRSTETRLPEGLSAADLGQSFVSTDNKAALISYYRSPIARGRKQNYVVFILDSALQTQVASYRWQVALTDVDTTEGIWDFTPDVEGEMNLNVTLRDSSNAPLRVLSLSQNVVMPNQELEAMIALDDQNHPIAGDPATSREVINDFLAHIHDLAPVTSQEALNRLLFGIASVEALDQNQAGRDRLIQQLASAVNQGQPNSFFQQASVGAGVCRIRPEILAMSLQSGGSPLIPWEEIPVESSARQTALQRVQSSLAALGADRHIDIFNLLRFPKANLQMCKLVLDALRTRYFSGGSYDSLLANAAQSQRLLENFKTGPIPAPP